MIDLSKTGNTSNSILRGKIEFTGIMKRLMSSKLVNEQSMGAPF